jgi:hypothetical protein
MTKISNVCPACVHGKGFNCKICWPAKAVRKYYILVGKDELDEAPNKDRKFEMIFGDYDKEVVEQEMEDTSNYVKMRVITLAADTQDAVVAAIAKLNGE